MFLSAAVAGAIALRVRPPYDDLQSLCALGTARHMGASVPRACRSWAIDRDADDRFDAHQGPPLGRGRKRGAHKQAIGRSRGGRNTKIHALADAKGRLLSILLSGGENARLSACPAPHPSYQGGQEVARRQGLRQRRAAAMATRSAAPGPSFPTGRTASSRSASTGKPTSYATASRMPSVGSRTSGASPPATTSWRETSSLPFVLPPLSYGGLNESGP